MITQLFLCSIEYWKQATEANHTISFDADYLSIRCDHENILIIVLPVLISQKFTVFKSFKLKTNISCLFFTLVVEFEKGEIHSLFIKYVRWQLNSSCTG